MLDLNDTLLNVAKQIHHKNAFVLHNRSGVVLTLSPRTRHACTPREYATRILETCAAAHLIVRVEIDTSFDNGEMRAVIHLIDCLALHNVIDAYSYPFEPV